MRRRSRWPSFCVAGTLACAGTALVTALAGVSCVGSDPELVGGASDAGTAEVVVGPRDAAGGGDAACGQQISSDFRSGWAFDTADTEGDFTLRLTLSSASRKGIASHTVDLPPEQSFRAKFTLTVMTASPYVPPADGVTFFWSSEARPVLGDDGSSLGFCSRTGDGGVSGSAVELFTTVIEDDAGTRHSTVGVKDNVDGTCDELGAAMTLALASPDAGGVLRSQFEVAVVVDGSGSSVTIRRDGEVVIDAQKLERVPTQILSVGFTGATGNDYTAQAISDFSLTTCP